METAMENVKTAYLDDLANTEDSTQELGQTILEAIRELKRPGIATVEVFVFTDRTDGHVWRFFMEKQADTAETFRFRAAHSPAPCSLDCSAAPLKVAESEQIEEVYEMLVYHITSIVREEATVPCCFR